MYDISEQHQPMRMYATFLCCSSFNWKLLTDFCHMVVVLLVLLVCATYFAVGGEKDYTLKLCYFRSMKVANSAPLPRGNFFMWKGKLKREKVFLGLSWCHCRRRHRKRRKLISLYTGQLKKEDWRSEIKVPDDRTFCVLLWPTFLPPCVCFQFFSFRGTILNWNSAENYCVSVVSTAEFVTVTFTSILQ